MSFHKSIPERPHGGTPPSWASTSIAAPPARSDPSGARVPPFARAPESRPAIDLAARGRDRTDRGGLVVVGPIGGRHPGQLPDRDAEAGASPPLRRTRPAPGPARRRPRRQPRRHGGRATRSRPHPPAPPPPPAPPRRPCNPLPPPPAGGSTSIPRNHRLRSGPVRKTRAGL